MFNLCNEGNHEFLFVRHIEKIFDSLGLSFIFRNQMPVNEKWIKGNVKQILVDQFVQNWKSQIVNSSRGNFCLEPYLLRVDQQLRDFLTKFRVSNTKIPIETVRWYNINKEHKSVQKI